MDDNVREFRREVEARRAAEKAVDAVNAAVLREQKEIRGLLEQLSEMEEMGRLIHQCQKRRMELLSQLETLRAKALAAADIEDAEFSDAAE